MLWFSNVRSLGLKGQFVSTILSIDPATDLAGVVRRLKRSKLIVTAVLSDLHIITVEVEPAALAKVRQIPGVIGVEQGEDVHLDPREIPDMGPGWPKSADRSASQSVSGASWRSPEWDATTA
jgi:hypothetical protein